MRIFPSPTGPRAEPEGGRRAPRRVARRLRPKQVLIAVALLAGPYAPGARAEVIEEIVARVNDDIITLSQLREREAAVVGELFSRYSGEELEQRVDEARSKLLRDMVRESMLLHRAESLGLETQKIVEVGIEQIKHQNNLKTNDELMRALREQGTTMEELRQQILRYNVPAILLDREVRQKVSVSDAEIEERYKARREELRIPETVSYTEIVIRLEEGGDENAQRARAEAAAAELAAGAGFEALVESYSDAPSREVKGKVGPLRPEELAKPIERAIRELQPGQVSPVVQSRYGFHIVRLDARTQERQRELSEVREEIEDTIREEKMQVAMEAYFDKLRGENIVKVSPDYKRYGEP